MKVLDTTFLIDLLNGKKETLTFLSQNFDLLTTQINMFELLRGLFLRNVSKVKIQRAFELFESIRVLPLDDSGIMSSAKISANLIKKGRIIQDTDCLIAGIALGRGVSTIVTKNAKHFRRIDGINVEVH